MNDSKVDVAVKKSMGKKTKAALVVAVLLVTLLLCGVFLSKYAKTLVTEEAVEPISEATVYVLDEPDTAADALDTLSRLLDDTTDTHKTRARLGTYVSVDDGSITFSGSESEAKVLSYIKNKISENISGYYPSHDGTFGDGFDGTPDISLTPSQIAEVTGVIRSEGEIDEQAKNELLQITVTPTLPPLPADTSDEVYSTFHMAQDKAVLNKLESDVADTVKAENLTAECRALTLEAVANAVTGKLKAITYTREYNISLVLTFFGELKSVGQRELSFNCTVTQTYEYEHVAIAFADDWVQIYPGDEETLAVDAVIAADAVSDDYAVSFESSDEKAVSIDKDGNIKCLAMSEKPVSVTVTLEYLGNTYTDTCKVYVTQKQGGA